MGRVKVSSRKHSGPRRAAPVVHLSLPAVSLQEIQFAIPAAGSNFWYLYRNGNTHPIAPGDLAWWGRGTKIETPEWVRGRAAAQNFPACFTRNQSVAMRVRLLCTTTISFAGTLAVVPTLDGDGRALTRTTVPFDFRPGLPDPWITVALRGVMPDEIGRFILRLSWSASGSGFTFAPLTTEHRIYSVYGPPMQPDYDSAADADAGRRTSFDDGTLTGTPKRMDLLFLLTGGRDRRHAAATPNDIIDLLWNLHAGINDTPGAPPYFDAGHNEYLTSDGTSTGTPIPLADQWLAWVPTRDPHWNDASCIGHVQVLKTMAAAAGFFARRTWIFPTTTLMPDGTTVALADTSLYCLGTYDTSRLQRWTFRLGIRDYVASPKLIEPGGGWENFEACLRTPNGRFLPGGYDTHSCPSSFRTDKGFRSAKHLLHWWANTTRPTFGRRFMCWVYKDPVTNERHYWDREGVHHDATNYVRIRERGKHLPEPTP